MANFNIKKMRSIIFRIIKLLFLTLTFCSCKKLIEIEGPKNSVSSYDVYNNDATALGAITSLYVNLSNADLKTPKELSSLSCIAGLSADELEYYKTAFYVTLSAYYQNALTNLNSGNFGYWGGTYSRLYLVNAAIEGINASKSLTPNVKQQLLGEAKFMRAFYYFYLVNLYGDVPLVLTTDYKISSLIAKSSKTDVYNQIVVDLKEAQNLLSSQYIKSDGINAYPIGEEERVRPTKWAAKALLARVYLYEHKWLDAELESSIILENSLLFQLEGLSKVFLKNNKEAIWQLQPIGDRINSQDANLFVLPLIGPSNFNNPVYLSVDFVNSFEIGDQRKVNWIGKVVANGTTYYFPYKYKVLLSNVANPPITEYSTVMRLAEQYLIRAESRAEQGNLSDAISDLDKIRNRAGLPLIKDINPNIQRDDLLIAILKERRSEFFTEWGHRWLDIKRTGEIDKIMSLITLKKGNVNGWASSQQYYPIALKELQSNPNLTPTPGY